MRGREITLWIDERWYDALSKQLKGETLEEHLEKILDEMCNQLPQREYERISHLICKQFGLINFANFIPFHRTE